MVDSTCYTGGAESVVDVHDADPAGAAVEHPQKSRDAVEAGAITDARRDGDYRHTHEASNDAREGPFHPGDHDEDTCALQTVLFMQEAMKTGDTNIVESVHCVAHELSGDDSFFSDREIGRARACNEH